MLQYSAIIITFVDLITMDFVELIDLNLSKYFSLRVTTDLFEMFLLYYMLNQLSWHILVLHINKYRYIAIGGEYSLIKNQIRQHEKKVLLFVILIYLFLRAIWLADDIIIEFAYSSSHLASRIYHGIYAFIALVLVLNEFKLYQQLKSTMINYLNFYYKNYQKNIRMLKYVNITFYITFGGIHLVIAIFNIQLDSIVGLSTIKGNTSYARLAYLALNVLLNTPLFLYVFINTYNIKFKEWIFAVMWGYKISRHFDTWSIFIKKIRGKNKIYQYLAYISIEGNIRWESILQSESDEGENESMKISFNQDYEVNDDYMHNYKIIYLSSSETKSNISDLTKTY